MEPRLNIQIILHTMYLYQSPPFDRLLKCNPIYFYVHIYENSGARKNVCNTKRSTVKENEKKNFNFHFQCHV